MKTSHSINRWPELHASENNTEAVLMEFKEILSSFDQLASS
jgi:hypothetical protein